MQEKAILGVDISKHKFDVCLIFCNKIRHKLFDNNYAGYQKLIDWCFQQGTKSMHICMEATSHYMEDLANFMHDLGHDVSIVNPAQIKAFTKNELLRGKTDKSDAATIARFCQANKPTIWQPQPKELRELRDMHRCLQSLKEQKIQLQNKLENDKIYQISHNSILAVI